MSFDLKSPFIKMGKYQQEKENDISQCLTCERRCNVKKGEFGFCGTRLNISGSIYTIIYGYIPAISIVKIIICPIQKIQLKNWLVRKIIF
ncbi:MAG: hypothetical protein P8Y97_15585 [Candidatus Lokiarchaeota archaeon]